MFSFSKIVKGAFSVATKFVKSLFTKAQSTTPRLESESIFQTEEERYKQIIPDQKVSIVSSYVKAVKYTLSSRELEVNYKGGICIYPNIPPDLYLEFLSFKGSKGLWARQHLFPRSYRYG